VTESDPCGRVGARMPDAAYSLALEAVRMICGIGLIAICLVPVPFISAQQPALAKHAIADTASAQRPLRVYLSPIRVDSGFRLTPNSYSGTTHVEQNVVFGPRPDGGFRVAPVVGVPAPAIDTWNAVQFVSPPIPGALELSALFSGHLDFISNKPEFDFQISVYELTSTSDYVLLSTYESHWSIAGDSSRTLFQPRTRQSVDFRSDNPTKAVIRNGSRLVVLITILEASHPKDGNAAGRDVGRGTIANTTDPLKISWYGESYIQLQMHSR
jgi:hypothetical protein